MRAHTPQATQVLLQEQEPRIPEQVVDLRGREPPLGRGASDVVQPALVRRDELAPRVLIAREDEREERVPLAAAEA